MCPVAPVTAVVRFSRIFPAWFPQFNASSISVPFYRLEVSKGLSGIMVSLRGNVSKCLGNGLESRRVTRCLLGLHISWERILEFRSRQTILKRLVYVFSVTLMLGECGSESSLGETCNDAACTTPPLAVCQSVNLVSYDAAGNR